MPRRRVIGQRKILPDPKFDQNYWPNLLTF